MKVTCLIACLAAAVRGNEFYNILSLDGGAMKNVITLVVLEYMETYGYEYALGQGYINASSHPRLPLKDMFQMLAGTSTGGVIAAALSVPSN